MSSSPKLLQFSILVVVIATIIFGFTLPSPKKPSSHMTNVFPAMAQTQNNFDLKANQLFSGAAGSTIEYNIYIENKGKSIASYRLTASSNKGYYVEVWRDTDAIGSGETHLIPPQGTTLSLKAGEVATLIAKVTIPADATNGTVDATTIIVVDSVSGNTGSVTVTTTVTTNLPYPSNWVQLGSDPTFPTPPPERIDAKAVYCNNNGTFIFFRMAEVDKPNPTGFLYCVYMDTKTGGQQSGSYSYDYLLSSDGILYLWNGLSWIDSGHQTFWKIDGTSIVLWTDLNNIDFEMQEIQILSRSETKDHKWKDEVGPFVILRNTISEIPLIVIPLLSCAVYFTISRKTKKGNSPRVSMGT